MTTTPPDAATDGDGDGAGDGDPVAPKPFRLLPRVTDENRHFWTGGAEGELRFRRCGACGYWIHPPSPRCPICLSKDLRVDAVSGRGVIHAFTVNHQAWYPGLDPPYVVAIVELPEQAGLRVTTNIVGTPPDAVRIGLPVRVLFEQYEDVWLPFFEVVAGGVER
jgi:uncharacterized OB-fold protein